MPLVKLIYTDRVYLDEYDTKLIVRDADALFEEISEEELQRLQRYRHLLPKRWGFEPQVIVMDAENDLASTQLSIKSKLDAIEARQAESERKAKAKKAAAAAKKVEREKAAFLKLKAKFEDK